MMRDIEKAERRRWWQHPHPVTWSSTALAHAQWCADVDDWPTDGRACDVGPVSNVDGGGASERQPQPTGTGN